MVLKSVWGPVEVNGSIGVISRVYGDVWNGEKVYGTGISVHVTVNNPFFCYMRSLNAFSGLTINAY